MQLAISWNFRGIVFVNKLFDRNLPQHNNVARLLEGKGVAHIEAPLFRIKSSLGPLSIISIPPSQFNERRLKISKLVNEIQKFFIYITFSKLSLACLNSL